MYKFKKIDGDKFSLICDKKQIEFTRTVKMANRLQSVDSEARFRVMEQLTEKGYTMDNNPFVVVKQDRNQTIRDESNLNYLIKNEKETTIGKIIMEIIEETFKMNYRDLFKELQEDPEDLEAVKKFTQEFMYIVQNGEVLGAKQTPSTNN